MYKLKHIDYLIFRLYYVNETTVTVVSATGTSDDVCTTGRACMELSGDPTCGSDPYSTGTAVRESLNGTDNGRAIVTKNPGYGPDGDSARLLPAI